MWISTSGEEKKSISIRSNSHLNLHSEDGFPQSYPFCFGWLRSDNIRCIPTPVIFSLFDFYLYDNYRFNECLFHVLLWCVDSSIKVQEISIHYVKVKSASLLKRDFYFVWEIASYSIEKLWRPFVSELIIFTPITKKKKTKNCWPMCIITMIYNVFINNDSEMYSMHVIMYKIISCFTGNKFVRNNSHLLCK